MATQLWFYQTEGQPSGPVDSGELRRLAESGIVRPDTLVRQGTSNRWVRAEQVRGLFQGLPPAQESAAWPPPGPPPPPPGPADVTATSRNAAMTVSEAYYVVFDIVASELANGCHGHFHHPISALKGYDIAQICTALKLTVANAFLLYADKDAFDGTTGEKKFSAHVEWCNVGMLMPTGSRFAADDQVDVLEAKPAFEFDDPRLLAQETPSSFAEYCKHLGADDPRYWQKVYKRLELEYTSASPRGNDAQPPECDLNDSGIRDHFLSIVSAFSELEADTPPHIGDCSNLPYPKKTILYAIRWLMGHYAAEREVADDHEFIEHCDKLNSSLSWLLTRVARDWQQIEPADKDAIAKLNECESFPDWALPLKAKYIDEDTARNEAFDVAFEVMKDRVALEKKSTRVLGRVPATHGQIFRPHTADDGFARLMEREDVAQATVGLSRDLTEARSENNDQNDGSRSKSSRSLIFWCVACITFLAYACVVFDPATVLKIVCALMICEPLILGSFAVTSRFISFPAG